MSLTAFQQQRAIEDFLRDRHIPSGLGTREAACSVAAINLALSGRLTDKIPECMSPVIGRWMIVTQDAMPDAMRNSAEWRALLPLAAGTGRECEKECLDLMLQHMWAVALPLVQPIADAHGFGAEWTAMCRDKTAESAAAAAARAARAARAAWAAWERLDPVGLLRRLIDVTPEVAS